MAVDRQEPNSPETEASVLSCLLSEGPSWWPRFVTQAGGEPEELFFAPEHRLVCRAMNTVAESASPSFSNARLVDEMLSHGDEQVIDDIRQFLISLQTRASVTTPSAFGNAVFTLIEQKTKRDQLRAAETVVETILTDPSQTPAQVSSMLKDAAVHRIDSESLVSMGELIAEFDQEEDALWSLSTGYDEYDDYLNGGLEPGRVYVFAARSKVGKTTQVMNIVANMILDEDTKVAILFASLETLPREFFSLMLACIGNVEKEKAKEWAFSSHGARRHRVDIDADEIEDLENAKEILQESLLFPVYSRDLPNGMASLENKVIALQAKIPEDTRLVVVLDHAQLISRGQASREGNGIREAMVETTIVAKRIATDYEVPFILISQMNRGEDGEMPLVRDLSESASIEQDADAIILLNRPAMNRESTEPQSLLEVEVARNRNGEVGRFTMNWDGATGYISSDESDEPRDTMTVNRRRAEDDDDDYEDNESRHGGAKKKKRRYRAEDDTLSEWDE